jgi:hypothetical protein
MPVSIERIFSENGERVTAGHRNGAAPSPLDVAGGPSLELACHLRDDLRVAIGELVTQLRITCGSLLPSAHPRAYCVTSPATWRCLRNVSEGELLDAIRKAQRFAPALTIPGDGLGVHRRLEDLLQRLGA